MHVVEQQYRLGLSTFPLTDSVAVSESIDWSVVCCMQGLRDPNIYHLRSLHHIVQDMNSKSAGSFHTYISCLIPGQLLLQEVQQAYIGWATVSLLSFSDS